MGREAKTRKDRVCHTCNQVLFTTAEELKEHARICVRLDKMGLVAPSIQRPETGIVVP